MDGSSPGRYVWMVGVHCRITKWRPRILELAAECVAVALCLLKAFEGSLGLCDRGHQQMRASTDSFNVVQ